MPELAPTLCRMGAAVFLLMGVAHGAMTLSDLKRPRYFAPRDPQLIPTLEKTRLGLSPRTRFWRAWLGFNLSHSLGLMVFGGGLIYLSFVRLPYEAWRTVQAAVVVVSVVYLVLAIRFWFRIPAMAAGVGALLLIASWLLGRMDS